MNRTRSPGRSGGCWVSIDMLCLMYRPTKPCQHQAGAGARSAHENARSYSSRSLGLISSHPGRNKIVRRFGSDTASCSRRSLPSVNRKFTMYRTIHLQRVQPAVAPPPRPRPARLPMPAASRSPRPAPADAGRWGPFERKGWRRLGRPSGSNLTLGTRSGGRLGVDSPTFSLWLHPTCPRSEPITALTPLRSTVPSRVE
jgi:hypothetical protein